MFDSLAVREVARVIATYSGIELAALQNHMDGYASSEDNLALLRCKWVECVGERFAVSDAGFRVMLDTTIARKVLTDWVGVKWAR